MDKTLVYLNGEYLPISEARISVLDRGFIFADGVYEVLPVFNGRILRMEQHLQRLDDSLHAIYMENPLSREEWQEIFRRICQDLPRQSLYVQISRGVSVRTQAFPTGATPTVLVMSQGFQHSHPDHSGLTAITHEDIRWSYCHIKSTALLACVLLRHRASLANASEAILIRDHEVTEGAASNVFVVLDGRIRTPPKSRHMLSGVTRDLLLELMDQQGETCQEQGISEAELRAAEEIWLTSSTWEVQPVVQLDGKPVGIGQPGPVYERVWQWYRSCREEC